MHSRLNPCIIAGLIISLAIGPAAATGQVLAEKGMGFPARSASPPNPALAPPRGARVDRYELSPRTVIVGFGKDVVYRFIDTKDAVQRHTLAGLP